MQATIERIFVPTVPPPQRHPLILAAFDALPVGEVIEIVNDHNPVPLELQFERVRSGQFDWQVVLAGPSLWQVRIERVAEGENAGTPSGCGGGGSACGCSGG